MSMQALLSASQSMARMQTMQSARTQMQGTENILRSESRQDGGNKQKDAKADALEEKSANLMGNLMGEIADVNETLKPDEEVPAEEAKKEDAATKPSKTDTVSLSDAATKQLGNENNAKPAVSEAVTYKADGSAKPSAPAKAAPAFKATA